MESIYIDICYHSFSNSEYKLATTQFHSDPMTLVFWINYKSSNERTRYIMKLIDKDRQSVIEYKHILATDINQLFHQNNLQLLKLI